MSTIFDKYLKSILNKKVLGKDYFLKTLRSVKKNSSELNIKGKIKFEVEKTKLELKKKYYELGMHIASKFKDEQVLDFTYDETFLKKNQEIDQLKEYISKIKNQKIRL